jgi:hypothetical protein
MQTSYLDQRRLGEVKAGYVLNFKSYGLKSITIGKRWEETVKFYIILNITLETVDLTFL